ncbi:RING finger protein 222 isoform X2 [Anolis sagrei]|nr:RING finger protein 222 [Anolis sagrei ordinatus]
MSQSKPSKDGSTTTSSECPVCYELFQSPKVSRRMLSCGHTFCHDCLVKCLLVSRDEGRLQNTLTCPVCRFVTFLCRKRARWLSKSALNPPALELPLSPSSLPCGVTLSPSNTLVVPGHFLAPFHGYDTHQDMCGCPGIMQPAGLEREPHIFIITQCGMPLIEENFGAAIAHNNNVEAPESVASSRSLGIISCFRSPIMLAIFLVSAVALLGAVLPWLLLERKNE